MKKHLYRITLVSIAAAILAACPSKSIKNLPETDTSVIKGPDRPTGTPDPIGTTVSGEEQTTPLFLQRTAALGPPTLYQKSAVFPFRL